MTRRARAWTAGCSCALLVGLGRPAEAENPGRCLMDPGDRAWIAGAMEAWRRVAAPLLALQPEHGPTAVVYDQTCVWTAEAPLSGELAWRGAPHSGAVPLPDGKSLPPVVASFAAPYDADRRAFIAMGLPTVWRGGGVESPLGLEPLMTAVFLHEMAHTRQFPGLAPQLAELTRRWKLPDDINDDSLQMRFKDDPEYRRRWELERDLLFQAAAASDDAQSRILAQAALRLMTERRARWFKGADAKWAALEDVFLTMEGVGQWAAYAYLADPSGGGLPPERALKHLRRNRNFWSQEQGLGMFLVLDRLLPDWKARVFSQNPTTAGKLLSLAASAP